MGIVRALYMELYYFTTFIKKTSRIGRSASYKYIRLFAQNASDQRTMSYLHVSHARASTWQVLLSPPSKQQHLRATAPSPAFSAWFAL